MKHKIVGIVILMLLATTVVSVQGVGDTKTSVILNIDGEDVLDQYQNETDNYAVLCENYSWAQPFRPKQEVLTRVELLLMGTSSDYGVKVSIKKGELTHSDTASVTKSSDEIPKNEIAWVVFDFNDIKIEKGEIYYIVITAPDVVYSQFYALAVNNDGDSYTFGDAYIKSIFGGGWYKWNPPFDFCFKTYGKSPNCNITNIGGGFGHISASVTNTGNVNLENINWTISLEGTVFIGSESSGTINSLEKGQSQTIDSGFILGFGKVDITITVTGEMFTNTVIDKKTLFGPFIF